MLKLSSGFMDSKTVVFSVLALAAIFAMTLPMDTAVAQTTDISPDGEGEYKDGDHEGKSCPFKNKTASVDTGLNI
jgi:hypothetical protein